MLHAAKLVLTLTALSAATVVAVPIALPDGFAPAEGVVFNRHRLHYREDSIAKREPIVMPENFEPVDAVIFGGKKFHF